MLPIFMVFSKHYLGCRNNIRGKFFGKNGTRVIGELCALETTTVFCIFTHVFNTADLRGTINLHHR